jgi:hypothetical protein
VSGSKLSRSAYVDHSDARLGDGRLKISRG